LTAVTEALANAVKHGCKSNPALQVRCRVGPDADGGMVIVVRDSGPGFDPGSVPCPMDGDGLNLDHGRGIFMIRQLMDDVRYEHHGTELHMTKKF
jgi:serine/threonine-protein kinase RsbW